MDGKWKTIWLIAEKSTFAQRISHYYCLQNAHFRDKSNIKH